jgi:hypothetical protein
LALGWIMYAEDNQDRIIGFDTKDTTYWRAGYLAPTAGPPVVSKTPPAGLSGVALRNWYIEEGFVEAALYNYVRNPNSIHCPGDTRDHQNEASFASYSGVASLNSVTAGYNQGVNSDADNISNGGKVTILTKRSAILHPSERIAWVEEADPRGDNFGSWIFLWDSGSGIPAWGDRTASFHGVSSSFGFVDGHAENRRWLEPNTVDFANSGPSVDYGTAWTTTPYGINNRDLRWIRVRYPCGENP